MQLDLRRPRTRAGPSDGIWLHSAVARLQCVLGEAAVLPAPEASRVVTAALTVLRDPPTHADAIVARALADSIRARLRTLVAETQPPPRMQAALAFVQEHYAERSLRLQTVAAAVGVSPCHLAHLFRACTGAGFGDHLTRTRVEASKTLLVSSNRLVKEVAFAVGYSAPGTFARAFHATCGLRPSQWRSAATITSSVNDSQDSPHETLGRSGDSGRHCEVSPRRGGPTLGP